jgi:y4mF family transcriptional regulator
MTHLADTNTLGETIRTERKRQGVTQVELAALSGVGVRFLRELEHGKPGCQLGRTFSVLNTLGITLNATTRN